MPASLDKSSGTSAPPRRAFCRALAWTLLALLVLLLAFRLSTIETLRETIAQQQARLAGNPDVAAAPDIGPAYLSVYAAACLLLAGITTFAAARAGAFSRRRLAEFLLIAGILALALASTFHAANRFAALVGTADLAASLAAAWAILLLCHENLLGARARRILAAAVIGLCAIAVAKSLMQYFIEFPDMAQFVKDHRAEVFRAQGIENDPVQQDLFLHRIASNELSGFSLDSDVLATELIPTAALLTLLIYAGILQLRRNKSPDPAETRNKSPADKTQIPPELLSVIALCLLAVALLFVLRCTSSKGGIAGALLAILAVAIGLGAKTWIARHRRALMISAAALACLGAAGVILYGRAHDALPTKSLLFRWHYWTASVPIIKDSPTLGVGLNNFGDYYDQFKRPSSPEDVKDPHNFFIRLAAEMGIPAACLVGLLILITLSGAFKKTGAIPCGALKDIATPTPLPAPLGMLGGKGNSGRSAVPAHEPFLPLLLVSLLLAAAWATSHIFLAEPINTFTTIITCFYALIAWTFFLAAILILNLRHPQTGAPIITLRTLAAMLAVAALAMLLYDQINIALVTGPVAMLFWLLLATADAPSSHAPASPLLKSLAGTAAALFLGAAIITLITVTIPQCSRTFPWDPARYETTYLQAATKQNWPAASAALDAALARSPRSIELLLQRIALHRQLGLPVAPDIRRIFQLDRANASLRVMLALPDSDLPPAERLAALHDALNFNAALDPAEAKRLSPETLAQIQSKIAQLEDSTHHPDAPRTP